MRPGPGQDCWSGSDAGTGAEQQIAADEGSWGLEAGALGSSPGSSPDCALGLTP